MFIKSGGECKLEYVWIQFYCISDFFKHTHELTATRDLLWILSVVNS